MNWDELTLLDIALLRNKNVYVMGRMEHVSSICNQLRLQGVCVKGILDNDMNKQGNCLNDIMIYAPDTVLVPYDHNAFIIIYSPKYWNDMLKQMVNFGYKDIEQIFILDRPTEEKNVKKVYRCLEVVSQIKHQYGQDVTILWLKCQLGDLYIICSFLNQYLKENNIVNYCLVSNTFGQNPIPDFFQINNYKTVCDDDLDALIKGWMFLGEETVPIRPLSIWQGPFSINACKTHHKMGIRFEDMIKIYALGLPQNAQKEVIFPESFPMTEGLNDEKPRVLLVPFSYSVHGVPKQVWITLAQYLMSEGYEVYVNINSEREENFIDGTISLSLGFKETISFMQRTEWVIGMRSGFFDITSPARCRRIVLYPKRLLGMQNAEDIELCNLKDMWNCENIAEIEVGNEISDTVNMIITIMKKGLKDDSINTICT